eukprot:NP_001021859.1 Uncharacterized protein CELE_ZK1151.1 [Caenorhabditis elegans]
MVGERYRSHHAVDPSDAQEKEVLDHYELNREKYNDERDNVQKKTFTKWVNKHLSKTDHKIDDLFVDLRDGYALIALLEALTGERIQKENGYTRFHRIQNVQYCLDFLKKKNIKLVNIRPEDIVEGNGKLTLGLIWTIILNFQVSVIRQRLLLESSQHEQMSAKHTTTNSQVSLHGSDATSARDALLQWARRVTAGYPRVNVNNFSSSWRDGLAFNAILHRYRSSAIDWNKISSDSVSNTERLNNAFAAADREFGVERLLDAEDVDTNNPDEKSIITYVSSLYNALPHEPEMSRLQKVQEEYIEEAYEWREWVVRAIQLVDDRHLQGTASELIYELQRFREDDLPPREEQKRRLTLVYEHLEKVMRSTELFAIPHELSAPELQRVWNELQNSIDRRFDVLERHRIQEGNSNDLLSRLARGIGITNEKLDLILKRIEDVEARVDTSPPAAVERTVSEIVDDLNALESPIARFFEDVEELKSMQHPEANDFYKQVYGLHQRRTTYLDRLTNQILVRLGVRTDSLHKENQQRLENMRKTSFSRVEECIEWVRVRMEKLTTMEFLEDLETLEHVFEQHKFDNRDIQDFRQNVDECIARQAEVSAEDTYEYCELLRVLESEYQQLRDLSAGRMLDLDSLIAFVRAAQLELIWVSERESIEVTRNWSDIKQLDLPMLTNYYKQLLHEMELREKQYNDVHNQGAALLNQGHPAIRVIEVYLRQMQSQWDWLLALSKCLEEHLRDALNLKSFMEEASDAEAWIQEQSVRLENNYNRTDFSLEEGERFLRELDEIKEILNKYHQVLMALTERCASISPLWQRGERIPHPIKVTALCDYSDENVTIKAGDDVYLLDNSDLIKWTIRDISGAEGQVPSVVFRIPPTDARLTALLNRLLQQFEKLKKLWDKKHRMVRFNMVLNTMRTIQGWDLDTFNSIDPDQRDAIMKALNDDANKLLSELDPNDPLALRLREELRRTNEHFWNLLNASQKPPEPDWASQYDQKMAELLKKLEEAWRELNDAVGKPISRSPEDLERVIHAHKRFEDALQALDSDVANVKELFRQLPNPTPTQRVNHDRLNGLWDDLWDLSRMYVERIKVLESVLNGMVEVADIVRQHEITLNSFDDLPAALDKLRGHHSQLLEINMVLKVSKLGAQNEHFSQQQTVIDQLNRNVALLRQHVSRTRINEGHHPDVDAIEDEVQKLNVRWENVNSQIASRLLAVESALQIQMVYRSEYETEMSWLDTVEETINRLRKPEELRPEQYQQQLDMLIAEYTNLQEHTQAIEHVNKEGGRFIHEAKIFDAKLGQYSDGIVGIHGPGIKSEFRRTKPQPKNGSQIVTEELELLNRRFAQLSSLILERRNTMQVLIQNWKRQKQENVTQVVSFREAEVSGMMTDLTRFRQEIFTTHLTFNSNPESIDAATKNVQNVKQSLDSWRDRIKERLDEIDRLCTEEGDSLTPEQYSALREMRRQLADEYDTVLRTVEGIHTRLNILSALLIEFSSVTSSMQSWMTDRTRLAGDIRHKSGDPMRIDEARFEAKSLMDEVIREESRLKTIGASVLKIEQEISAMRDDVRASGSTDDVGISVDEVYETRRRVEDDYMQLLRQCQDLISFQNRLHAMNDEHSEQARRADEWLQMLQNDVEDVDQDPRFQRDEDRIQRIEELNRMAAGGSSQLDDAEQASRRLLTALEGTNVANDVRARHEELANLRRGKHQKVIDRLSQNMMEAASRKAEAEGVKQAVENLRQWSEQTAQRTRQPVQLPLTELDLHEARKDEQVLHGEIENRLALIEELEKKAADVGDHASLAELQECKMKLKRSNSDLKGLRDNIFDAINGLQTVNSEGETLSRAVDSAGAKIRSARLPEAQSEVEALQDQADNLERITNNLCNIPNVTRTEPVIQKSKDLRKRVDSCAQELDARMGKLAELESLDAEFDGAKNKLSSFIGAFDDELKGLEKVSIDKEKLAEQRRQTQDLVDKHSEGNAILDDVEAIAQKVTAEDPSKTGSAQKSVGELGARLQRQASELKARGDKINKLDSKATSFAESEAAVLGYIEKQKDQLSTGFPVPATKEGVKSQLLDLERMNKTGKEEQRRVDDARHSARELAREASVEKEVQDMNQREKKLLDEWEDLADQFDASESQKAAGKINSLVAEIADLDPIGRSRDELQKQKKEVVELAGDLGSAQTKMLELGAEWEAALGAGIVAQPVFEMNRAATDELNKLAARAGKRLAQREKKITETEDEIDKLHADADQIVGALEAIAKDEALQGAPSQLLDPKQVSEKVRQLKESLKPVGEKMDAFNTDCKLLIKTAGPESDTKELDSLLKKVGDAYSDVVGKVSDKEMSVDAAVQQQGKVEDAYRALLNWLEETEEMMENRKKPSADAKVAKAQLHDYEVLMKHVEDKKPSVDGFKAMIEKIVAEASSDEEKKALGNKNAQIEDRYKDLLNSAVDRQRKLLDAVDLAERLQEVTIPLDSWLQSADKRLQALAKVPITVEKAEEMIGEQEALQDELEHKSDDLKDVLEIAPMLASLVSVEDANSISGQVNQLEARARALDAGITNMRPLLESFLQQIQDFTLDAEDMTQFVGETEVKLGELDELPIEPDDLVEQTNILAEIAVSIADRDEMMANIFEVGKQLAIQGEPEEALIAQKKLDDLKFRYADLMTSADEKIALLAKAIPLSEGFHEGFDTVMQVLEDMDRDLQTIDEEDPETQAELIFLLEEDISQKMRPSVDELTALSNQLQVLCSADKADELQTNTIAMNKLVNSVADRVARRAERIEMASKQSRAVLDDLQYLIEWFSAARERILEGAPPSLDLEVLKSQLKHQRITNEEASANKVQFRNVAGEAKKVARQLGMEGNEANEKISDTVDEGKELVEEVMALCADRTETLERALALMEQLTSQFDELNKWLDQMDAELQASPSVTTATPAAELREMHDHNEELARMVAAYRPIIEGFKSDVGSLHEVLAEDQAPLLESVAGELVQGYEEVREAVRARGHAIDNMMGATIGFGERLETLVANLQGAADRLRENEGISADPSVLESRLAENRSIVESLRDKQNAYDALKQTASELLASAPEGDAAAGDVENKLNRLEKLWKEIEREAVDRGVLLEDVLDKAKHFWSELDSCQKAVDDLRNRLELVEPATGHPEQLADQQEIMAQVASEMERARPRIEALSIAGKQLADYVPDDEKAVIENQVANVRGGFSTITGLFAEKKRDLIAAMEEAMTFHGDLQELLKWLDMAEQKLLKMSPVEHAKHMTEIEQLLKELHTFKDEVHERGVAKEQVVATALQLAADAPPHLAATVRQPVADLNTRWSRLNAALAEREHKLENLMLQMGKLASTIAQLTAWMDKTRATLKDIAPPKNAVNLRDIEIAQCKLVVLSNDIHAHQDSVNAVNRAAQKYIQTSGALDAETSDSLKSMNLKWEDIQKVLESLAFDMEVAKKEAENVGGEVEKWQRWLEETESALLSTKPTGGLPETAEFQLDEFKALKLDVEHNASPLEAHLHATEQHLKEEPQDADTWLSKTHGAMKTKWNKVKELLVDREKKLQVAYEQAVALESALNDMEDWIIAAERKLTDQPSISRLPDVIEKQLAEHESWMEEVAGRKMAMTKHQASGVHMQYYCEKKDAIPIKNRLVSLKHRVEKISGRTAERAKQLAVTRDEVATWQDGLHDLEHFISDVLVKIAPEPNTTSSLEKLKAKLEEVKEAQRDVTAKQTLFDVTRKRGIGLAERATRSEYKQISMTNEKMSKKWAEMLKKLRDRLREAEQAVLEGGAFEESMNDLESWVDDELERYQKAEHEPVFADIDGVRALVDEESRRSAERKTKENGVKTVVKKADALMASGVDEKDSIAQAKERLVEKWNQVEEAARHRGNSIKEAEQAAEEFDAKTHALLDWLAVEEQKLKASGLDEVEGVKQEMDEAKGRYQECLKKGEEILSKCQPAAEPILRNWMRVVEARWKEVSEKVDEREFTLLEQEQKAKEQNEQIEKLAKFAAQKREELNRMIEQPPAQDLDTMEQNICDFANLDSELREQQPEVDAACKSAKKGARNPAAEMLSTEWKKLWLDAMGLQSSLDNQKALLEEMKRLEGWKWEDWKERYVEWNDHAKARVNDLFRRIDRLHTGNVPRQVFIDGIIGSNYVPNSTIVYSKFPTSRLEMAKVADRFDKGDGMINAKEFINALRFDASNRNAKPQTDTEKITHEIELQKKTCSCCTPYQIEKISENHYRFGDTHIKRMVRILRSTVMVRVGGGWESLDEFLHKHDPCRAKGRLNINMFPEARPIHALDSMRSFTKNRHGKQLPTTGTPGPIMKIREKTDRSVPMSGGLGGTAGYTVTTDSHRHTDARPSRIPRAPSDMSAGRLSRVGSVSNSKNSIVDSSTPSRPESRASSDAGDRQTRIPSLRARKGQRYIPQGPSSSSSK